MRDILFKAKRIDNGEWIEGGFCQSTNGRSFLVGVSKRGYIDGLEMIPETICQYTGLTDKNGNKIWENDIVMLDDDYWVVEWNDADAMFVIECEFCVESFSNVWNKDCEVYGNLFDNPELLEGGAK